MSDIVISVENLSKSYQLGQISTGTLTRDLEVWWAKVHRRPNPMLKIGEKHYENRLGETIWALKEVNFTVERGEVLGIIGRNGAGKSTVLKILSRVTAPTSGKVKVKGRIASLLEVGTGFHPDLTGRENIYLNGAILGMKQVEVRRKFDEIVAFAEIEKFIDTPVKRYSSGMYVRLAFAVAAHLEPEILVVDEVLAVGDAQFQKKCLGKMNDVSKEGRTVLFVSHNMNVMSQLCRTAILLAGGTINSRGDVHTVISKYLSEGIPMEGDFLLNDSSNHNGSGEAYFSHIAIKNGNNQTNIPFVVGDDIIFDLTINVTKQIGNLYMSVDITTIDGVPVYHLRDLDSNFNLGNPSQESRVLVTLKNQKLYPGEYLVSLWLGSVNTSRIDYVHNCARFTVRDGGLIVKRELLPRLGMVYEVAEWTHFK